MASADSRAAFINTIAPLIKKYAKAYGYQVCSGIIAQACCESAYGASSLAYKYHNYFGLKCGTGWKGASVNMRTGEEYTVGKITMINDNFRVYSSMEEGVKGYFEFIQYPRYSNLKSARTPEEYLQMIKKDGFATSSAYVNTNLAIVNNWNLRVWDNGSAVVPDAVKDVSYGAIVTASVLNVRTGAGQNFRQCMVNGHVFQLPQGIVIAIEKESNGFGKLAGYNGWVSLMYLKKG